METVVNEALSDEVKALREKLERVDYETKAKYEDQIESAKSELTHVKAALDGKLANLQPGDLVLMDTASILNKNPAMWMQLAKKYNCTFVAVPEGGLEAIRVLGSEQLESMGLRKLDGERSTHLQKVHQLSVEIDTAMHTAGDNTTPERRSNLLNASRALKAAEAAIRGLEMNPAKPTETVIPTGSLIGG